VHDCSCDIDVTTDIKSTRAHTHNMYPRTTHKHTRPCS
jgi:hypothetical protein